MATTTPKYGLRKPDPTDLVNVSADIGGNMDLLDAHAHIGTYALISEPIAATKLAVGDLPPSIQLPAPFPETVITKFQTGHGYGVSNVGSSNVNDTTDYVLGTQAATVTTVGNGSASILFKYGGTSYDTTGKSIKVWVKIDDVTHLAFGTFRCGDTSLANQYNWNLAGAGIQYYTSGDWVVLTLNWQNATVSGTPNRAAVTDWRIEFLDDAAAPITFRINGFALVDEPRLVWPNGLVTITFDDGYIEQYTNARPVLDTYGYPATSYVIQENVASGSPNFCNVAQVTALRDQNGWEIAAHAAVSASHNQAGGFTAFTAAQLDTELETLKNWMVDNGLRGLDHIAYPQSMFNSTVITECRRFLASGRTTHRRTQETWPPADPFRLRCYSVQSTDTTGTVQTLIDNAYANGGWLILAFHKIVTGAPGAATEYTKANLQIIVDYIATKGIPVRTIGQALSARSPINARADVQTFTTAGGTWTKPAGAKAVQFVLVGAGGGGGSGRKGAAGSVRCGGGGGASGMRIVERLPATDVPTTLAVVVGAGGLGGTAVTANSTSGNAGGGGAATTASGVGFLLRAHQALTASAGGTAALGTGGSSVGGLGSGGSASTTGLVGAAAGTAREYPGGGGSGGGVSAADAASAGGNGAAVVAQTSTAPAGGAIGTVGTAGGSASAADLAIGGTGGGGGGSSITGNAGDGGAGGFPGGGGGGGGAALDSTGNSGAGGVGGAGTAVIITYFQ